MKTALTAFLSMKPRQGDAESAAIIGTPELRAKVIMQIERGPMVEVQEND